MALKAKITFTLALLASIAGCNQSTDGNGSVSGQAAPEYNFDIRPIISDNCFQCHGPDTEGGQKAGLRLDLFASATDELPESPGKFAIVPGDPDSSELIRRITSTDPDVMMPPPDSNNSLSAEEINLIEAWVSSGAEYQKHWAYVVPEKSAVPEFPAQRISSANDIDNFIVARLVQDDLQPAQQADKATLINRVTLDLTGLPPTLAAVDEFVADDSADAYENLVESLLTSVEHAEQMTAQWLDIARFADTDGYLEDAGDRLLHPWRDWVIESYQNNMPFDDFLTWQLAGDLLPESTQEQKLATAFLRLGQRSSENGIIVEEYDNEYAIDRVETLGVGILGHTVGCARCHDHKYDPISIRDFYSFAAFFSDTGENGFYTPGGSIPAPGFLGVESGSTLNLPDAETDAQLNELETRMANLSQQLEDTLASAQTRINTQAFDSETVKAELAEALEAALVAYYSFESFYEGDLEFAKIEIFGRQEQGQPMTVSRNMPAGIREDLVQLSSSNITGQVEAVIQSPISGEGIKGNAFYFDDQNKGYFGGDVGDYDRTDAFSLDFWIRFNEIYDEATVLNHNQHIRFASNGYTLDVEQNHLRFDIVHTPNNLLSVISEEAVPPEEWSHITVTYDGSSKANGIQLYLNGKALTLQVLGDNLTQTMVTEPLAFIDDTIYGLAFGKRWQQYTLAGSALDEVKVFNRDLSPLEISFLHTDGEATISAINKAELDQFRVMTDEDVLAAKAAYREVAAEHNQLISWQPEIMVMGEDPFAAPMQVKKRGVYTDPGEVVQGQALEQIFPWDEALPNNRLGLSQWLFDPENPLTSRVYVNRLWQSIFGRGLVETAEDFGTQGAVPSHPQLLDWLAIELMDSGWDTRHMLKLMVMSSTYRQDSSVNGLKKERDPFNHLLSRGVRLRHSAEVIRDNALFASGLLNNTVGGPSVHPYQPEGVWKAVSVNQVVDYPAADQVPLAEHHRRTMYGYVKRAAQHPALQVFDFPQRITTIARRRTSNTPLQALVMLNDEQYLEAYEGIAFRALQESSDLTQQINHIYKLALRREASSQESRILLDHYNRSFQRFSEDDAGALEYLGAGLAPFAVDDDQLAEFAALASTARIVMNSPDAYTRH
ncbi:MAG: DUF1553 domain-containing protein [Gammaproteobacteria bacterium]|nr:DUF1553 domain-containing protein [Gammaproteobacteria bacterium]